MHLGAENCQNCTGYFSWNVPFCVSWEVIVNFIRYLQSRVVKGHLIFGSSRVIWSHFRVRVASRVSRVNFSQVKILMGTSHRMTARITGMSWYVNRVMTRLQHCSKV